MKLIALLLVRNEQHELGFTLRVLLRFCDAVVIMEHRCVDRTHEIVCECAAEVEPGRVIVAADDHEGWDEMRLRESMLSIARQHGATHLFLSDADEFISANLLPAVGAHQSPYTGIRYLIEEKLPPGQILTLPLYNVRGGISKYHGDGVWGRRITSVAFADDPALGWFTGGLHSREPRTVDGKCPALYEPLKQGDGGVIHLWGASERRLAEKHRMYRILEALQWPDKPHAEIEAMYRMATEGRPQFRDVPANWNYTNVPEKWLQGYEDLIAKYLDLEGEPWQTKWCDEMIAMHGRERFAGLKV